LSRAASLREVASAGTAARAFDLPPGRRLGRSFFARDTQQVARELLGKILARRWRGVWLSGRIVEVESYVGADDLACHAAKGRTARTETLYGPPGRAYVYLIYGMYQMMNVVTERSDFPAAVLIRALEPLNGLEQMRRFRRPATDRNLTNGPGKLTRALRIDRQLNREDLTTSARLSIWDDGQVLADREIMVGPRIGIDYARHCVHYPWRYYVRGNPYVSRK
jgi:DNA-3-methyladenine glycosylase